MKINDIHAFVVVAEKSSFTRAAEALFMTQPALSRKIRDIEAQLGCKLLERSTRSVKLTVADETFYRHAKIADREMREAAVEIGELINKSDGLLRIGYTPVSGGQIYLMEALTHAMKRHPGIEFELRRAYVQTLVVQVKEGRLDCCMVSDLRAEEDGLDYEPLFPIYRYAILPKTHPLAEEPEITYAQIAREPRIALPPALAPNHARAIEAADKRLGIEPAIVAEAKDVEELLLYVGMGRGIGILAGSVARDERIASVPIRGGFPSAMRTVAWVKGRRTEGIDRLIDAIRAVMAENIS